MKNLNDYELLEYISDNNEDALKIMFEKYKPLIINIAKKYRKSSLKLGLELNDLIQEGMIGLSNAINTFKESMNVKFYTFAKLCIERRIITVFKTAKRDKNKFLNESVALIDEDYNLENLFGDYDSNPEKIVIDKDERINLEKLLLTLLSKEETKVYQLKCLGFSNIEIGEKLNKTKKQIDNTIQRMRTKYKSIL